MEYLKCDRNFTYVSFNSGNQPYVENTIPPFLTKGTMGEAKHATCQGSTTGKWQPGLDPSLQEPNVSALNHETTTV